MIDFTDWLLHLSPWSSWCLDVLECESGDSVSWQGPVQGGGLWEVLSTLIVKVLWKSEPEVMAEEVSGVRSSIRCELSFPESVSLSSCV